MPALPLWLDVVEEESLLATLLLLLRDRVSFAILLVAECCGGEPSSWVKSDVASSKCDPSTSSFPLASGAAPEETAVVSLRAGGDCRVRLLDDDWFLLL